MPNRLRGCGRYMQSVIIPGDACVVCGWDRDKCLAGPAEERAAAAAAAPPQAAHSTRGSTRHRAGGTNKTSSNHTAVKAAVGEAAQRNRKTLPKGGAGTGKSPSKASEQTTSMGVDKHRLAATNVMYHGSVLIGGQNSGKGSTHTRIDKRNHGGGYHTKTRQPRSEKPDTSAAVAAANQAAAATRERQDKLEQHAAEADRLARERQAHMDAEMDRQKRHHGYARARRTARPASPASSYSSYATHSDVHTYSPEPAPAPTPTPTQAQASSPAPVQTRVGTYKPRTRTTKPAHAAVSAGVGAGSSTRSGAWSDRSGRSDRTDRADTASTRGQRQTATPQRERSYTPQATSRRPDSAESADSSTTHRPATAWSPRPKAATTSAVVTTARHHHRSSSKRPGTASRKTPAVTSRTAQQAAMLSMAADAARNQGDMSTAQGLYEKTADLFETLGLEEQYAKENKKTGNRHHHHRHNHGGSSRHGPGHGHSHSRSNSRHPRHDDYRDDWYGDGSGSGGSTSRRSNDPERAERKWMAVTMERSRKEDGSGRAKTGDTMTGSSSDSTLLRAAQFDEGQQTLLRKLFATYSQGPTLSSSQLAKCLADHGCRGSASAYFSAFDRNGNRTWIDSSDFLVGIAALDPLTPHTGPWLAERARLIFRFYASGSSNMLMKQLVQVIDDGSYIAGDSHESPEQRARILNPGGGHVNQRKFVASVVNGEIPGTSGLFRYSILQHMM